MSIDQLQEALRNAVFMRW